MASLMVQTAELSIYAMGNALEAKASIREEFYQATADLEGKQQRKTDNIQKHSQV